MADEVTKAVKYFFDSGIMNPEWCKTLIVLILEIPNPTQTSDFIPIRLCNVIYEGVAKVMANRVRGIMETLRLENQTENQRDFVPGRSINENSLIAHKVLEFLRKKKKGGSAYVALKLDMNKAYD